MSNIYQLKALLHKNLIIMKRNIIITLMEIFSPMILIFLLYILRSVFKVEYIYWNEDNLYDYILYNSTMATNNNIFEEFFYRRTFPYCYIRSKIALIGKNFPKKLEYIIEQKIIEEYAPLDFLYFETINDLNEYVKSPNYGNNKEFLCFGIYFDYNEEIDKYDISLHYFASINDYEYNDIPSTLDFFCFILLLWIFKNNEINL